MKAVARHYMVHLLGAALLVCVHISSIHALRWRCFDTPNKICDVQCTTIKHYPIRSQGQHKDRRVIGAARFTHKNEDENPEVLFSTAASYSRTYRPKEALQALLGQDIEIDFSSSEKPRSNRTIAIQGSGIKNRNPKAWLADYFYLPRDFDGRVSFDPRITTYTLEWDAYVDLNPCLIGLYLRAFVPLAHTQWDLNMCETVLSEFTENSFYPAGYFSWKSIGTSTQTQKEEFVNSFSDFMAGKVIQDPVSPPIVDTPGVAITNDPDDPIVLIDAITPTTPTLTPIVYQPIRFARMTPEVHRETKIADVHLEIGWNILQCPMHHVGISVQGVAPTGTKSNPCYLFAPRIGNGNHWELGGGVSAHYMLYQSDDEDCNMAVHFDATVTHLFKDRQLRTFDLRGKPNSAYMLASKFGPNEDDQGNPVLHYVTDDTLGGFAGGPPEAPVGPGRDTFVADGTNAPPIGVVPKGIFANEYAPVANISTLGVSVSTSIQTDLALMFSFHSPHFTWDLGYNLWARSRECVDFEEIFGQRHDGLTTLCSPADRDNTWALKGDSRMFGFVVNVDGTPEFVIGDQAGMENREVTVLPLAAMQSDADIHNGTNSSTSDAVQDGFTNPNVDSPFFAANGVGFVAEGIPGALEDAFPHLNPPIRQILAAPPTGPPDRQIRTSVPPVFLTQKDLDIVRIRHMSHKVFTNMMLVCPGEKWQTYVSIGGSVEIAQNDACRTQPTCISYTQSRLDVSLSQWSVWFKVGLAIG